MTDAPARPLENGRPPNWALWDKFQVPQYEGDGNYLTRWRLIQTPWFGIYLHKMEGPDPRPTLHDHPWNFISIVLRGGYVERRLDPQRMVVNESRYVRLFNLLRLEDAHSIRELLRVPTWTLVLAGPRKRTWGYLETDGEGWHWTRFDRHRHNEEFLAALARRPLLINDDGTVTVLVDTPAATSDKGAS